MEQSQNRQRHQTSSPELSTMNSEQPKVIFLDAVGTLFGVRGSVGGVYGAIAQEYGVKTNLEALDRAFVASFQASSPPIFPDVSAEKIPVAEFQWWYAIVKNTFERVGVFDRFTNFSPFFEQLYHYFATDKPWSIYPDTIPALTKWQNMGIELGVISNFDTRLDRVLELLELKQFFSSITISSLVGAAKPDRRIFKIAIEKHQCIPEQAWHIGDSWQEDYQGAAAVGIRSYLINRHDQTIFHKNQLHNLSWLG